MFLRHGLICLSRFCFIFFWNMKEITLLHSKTLTKMIMRRHASCLAPKSLGLLGHVRMANVVFNDYSVPIVAAFSESKCELELNKY